MTAALIHHLFTAAVEEAREKRMIFYLGIFHPGWLREFDIPLFVSRRSLCEYRTPPRAKGPWALDSGGFSELSMFGQWTISTKWYAEEVARWSAEVVNLQWAAVMDWMCETPILISTAIMEDVFGEEWKQQYLAVKPTERLTWVRKNGPAMPENLRRERIRLHQKRTIASYLDLRALEPEMPWVPVLQGWSRQDYLTHREMYSAAGVDLTQLPLVGLGSVCRRQHTGGVEDLIRELHSDGIRLHAFGFKLSGLRQVARYLASSDSTAWSYEARRGKIRLPGCKHARCHNCRRYAMLWRERALAAIAGSEASEQGLLFR